MSSTAGFPCITFGTTMSCPKCNAVLPDASAFCNKCGASLTAAAGPAQPLQAAQPPPLQEPEQELWKGRFSGKAQGHWWVLWFAEMPALVYLWFRIPPDFQKKPYALWTFVAAAVLPVFCILWSWIVRYLATK
jgi:hypothetical protein